MSRRPQAVNVISRQDVPNTGAGAPSYEFNAHAGEVMGSPHVVPILWGADYLQSTGVGEPNLGQQIVAYLQMLFSSPYVKLLSEYNVGSVTLESGFSPAYTDGPKAMSETDIAAQLTSWIQESLLPIPAEDETNLLFLIFPPSDILLTYEGHSQNDPPAFGGYHHWAMYDKVFGKENLFYGIVIGNIPLDQITMYASHEIAEAFTDRSWNGWYTDNTLQEIGDVCNAPLGLNGYAVASYWRESVLRCLMAADLGTEILVPNIKDDSVKDASEKLNDAGLKMNVLQTVTAQEVSVPTILSQNPSGGSQVGPGALVSVVVGDPPKIKP